MFGGGRTRLVMHNLLYFVLRLCISQLGTSRAHDDIIVIVAEEEECVTSKNSRQAEAPACVLYL